MKSALTPIAHFAFDCAHIIMRAPTGSKLALLNGMLPLRNRRMGFDIQHPEPGTASFLYREIFARQHYFFRTDNPAPLIFDCGSNVGVATMYFKWLYPASRILAFEADATTFAVFQRNIRTNYLSGVETHHCALWDKNGEVDFFTDPLKPGMLHMSTDAARLNGRRTTVPARRLSQFITEPVEFLKLDVEGAEHRVLEDLVASGKISFIQQMVIEYHHRLGTGKSCLAGFLKTIEEAGFEYQVNASMYPVLRRDVSQDILIGCYRPLDSNGRKTVSR
jgi:FkbM family methyltransferase